MSDIIENLKDILENYKVIDNKVELDDTSIVEKIETEYKNNLETFVKEISGSDDYIVSFEASKGDNLLRVPFATIYNKNFSNSYKEGLFIGLSIYCEKGFVYLKLDQGLSSINGDFNLFFVRGEKLRQDYITQIPDEFEFSESKCGAGNVLGKNYTFDDLSIELLGEDLKYLISVYEDVNPEYDEIKKLSFNEIVDTLNL